MQSWYKGSLCNTTSHLTKLWNPAESKTSFSGQDSRFLRLQKLIKRECQLRISSRRFSHQLSSVAWCVFGSSQERSMGMGWCLQITRGEDRWTSEMQGQHSGADATREEIAWVGLNPNTYRQSHKEGWIQWCGWGSYLCFSMWFRVLLQ